MNIINNEKRNYIMKSEKMNNDEVPCSMQMPKTNGQSDASKHVRKEIDDWLKEGNEKTIIPTKENE
jgi:hypothetical protein|tara:strand:+ start:41 stop:238 length:198 start_codon:yes stop_codon:yes gene_type:complete